MTDTTNSVTDALRKVAILRRAEGRLNDAAHFDGAADTIDTLRARLAEANQECTELRESRNELIERDLKLTLLWAEAQADADRYRWLTTKATYSRDDLHWNCNPRAGKEIIDAAIDAAKGGPS